MEDPSRSPSPVPATSYYSTLGIPKTASLPEINQAYKTLSMTWNPSKNPPDKAEAEAKIRCINEAYSALRKNKSKESKAIKIEIPKTPKSVKKGTSELEISSPTLLWSTSNRVTPTSTPPDVSSSFLRSITPPTPLATDLFLSSSRSSSGATTPTTPTTPPKETIAISMSKTSPSPIIYSQSGTTPRKKPPPVEKKLKCTLEELCHGALKTVTITRDAISHFGVIVKEEETLTIKVKPGWRKGTKITFEGKGDERPGTQKGDIIFVIDEKRHRYFKRDGDDLHLGVEIPLVQALTGCTITIPLLGGDNTTLTFDDEVLHPGYVTIIPGQGMPKSKKGRIRGDLVLKFLIQFPTDLSDKQRSEVVSILEECSSPEL